MIKKNLLIENFQNLITIKNNLEKFPNMTESSYNYLNNRNKAKLPALKIKNNKNNQNIKNNLKSLAQRKKNNKKIKNNKINKNKKRILISLQKRILSIKKLTLINNLELQNTKISDKTKELRVRIFITQLENQLSNMLGRKFKFKSRIINGKLQLIKLKGQANLMISSLKNQKELVKKINIDNKLLNSNLKNKLNDIKIQNNNINFFSTGLPTHVKRIKGLNYEIKNGLIYTTLSPIQSQFSLRNNTPDYVTGSLNLAVTKNFFIFLRKFKIRGFDLNSIINYNFTNIELQNSNNISTINNSSLLNKLQNINTSNQKDKANNIKVPVQKEVNNLKNGKIFIDSKVCVDNLLLEKAPAEPHNKITICHYPYANQLLTVNGDLKIKNQTLSFQDPNNKEFKLKEILPIELLQGDGQGKKFKSLSKFKDMLPNKFQNRSQELKLRVSKYMKFMQTANWDIAKYKQICFKFIIDSNKAVKNVYILLNYTFHRMYSYISKPIIIITPNKVTIKLFYFKLKSNAFRRIITRKRLGGQNYFKILFFLGNILSRFFKKPVELVLIRIYHLYNESQILADAIGFLSSKKKMRFRRITKKIFRRSRILSDPVLFKNNENKKKANAHPLFATVSRGDIKPSYLTGITARLGGRLLSQKVRPRKTVESLYKGSLSNTKTDFVSSGRFTSKNKRGAYTISISLGHICI